jgi:hypothetical protein
MSQTAYITTGANFCEAVLLTRLAALGNGQMLDMRGESGALEALYSPLNRKGFLQQASDVGRGTVRPVRVSWQQPRTETDVIDADPTCDTGAFNPYLEDSIIPTQRKTINFSVSREDVYRFCADALSTRNNTGLAPAPMTPVMSELYNQMASALRGLRDAYSREALELLSAVRGRMSTRTPNYEAGVGPFATKV